MMTTIGHSKSRFPGVRWTRRRPILQATSGIFPNEKVQIVNINNGERFETYVIKGERGSGQICLNGPAARKVQLGDKLIVIAYGMLPLDEAKNYTPVAVYVNENNQQVKH